MGSDGEMLQQSMPKRRELQSLDDYFIPPAGRQGGGVYFCRINGYSDEIEAFIKKYYEDARKSGVIAEGKIPNPDERQLAYYGEIMGMEFSMDQAFIAAGLKRWLPRMDDLRRQRVAAAMCASLASMERAGKTPNMVKNLYIKLMCWLYYKFERVLVRRGEEIPKILYEGEISRYELELMSILSAAGCDIVLLQYRGDGPYLKLDPHSERSQAFAADGARPFPEGFCIQSVREALQEEADREQLYGQRPCARRCTNAWIKGEGLADIRKSAAERGTEEGFYYNCFCRISGVEDKLTYVGELLALQQELKAAKRSLVVIDGEIPAPSPDEIGALKRGNYAGSNEMILDLSRNLACPVNPELQRILHEAFVDVMLDEAEQDVSLNRLTNRAVYLLCWLKRYEPQLFSGWSMPGVGCFIYLGGCKNAREALFVRFLARLPLDVLILCPDLNTTCCLTDALLYEIHYGESLPLERFPLDDSQARMGTAAYHAERELDTLMYEDSGMYRNRQFRRANVVSLQTMYEEIAILWDQELKYRPGFRTEGGVVTLPVIFAKVSGVKDGEAGAYWTSVRELITSDTLVVKRVPYVDTSQPNPMKPHAAEFLKNGRLLKQKIKSHPRYPYGILREDIQDFMLEKLEAMLAGKLIKGIGENGMEYTVIAQVLNLPKDVVRMIQKFDFTKKNPKLVYINPSETLISLEDSILAVFLNLIGFDIIFFVPTGYQSIERYFQNSPLEEHQIGEYMYDLQVPDLKSFSARGARPSWRDKIFKRGN